MRVFLRKGSVRAFFLISRCRRGLCLPNVASRQRERWTPNTTGWVSFSCQDISLVSSAISNLHTKVAETGKPRKLDDRTYDKLSNEVLDELAEFFEDLGDSGLSPTDYDVTLASGVLTINAGGDHGTYVINKQAVNKQIWFSSPRSGPKRYDVIDGRWRYAHSGEALYDRLHQEFSEILGVDLDMSQLKHSHIMSDPENWAH